MAFEYTIERVFREERERISAESWKNAKIESIVELLSDYGDIPDRIMKKLHYENNTDTLRKWFKLAAKVSSIQEFMEKM